MSLTPRGNFKMALASVRSTKWRSFLTMLGIIIGIVSVVTVFAIGEGVKRQISAQIDQFGKDLITIRPGQLQKRDVQRTVTNADLLFGLNSINGLTSQDLKVVQESDHVRLAAPLSVVPGEVATGDRKLTQSFVLATNEHLPGALNQSVPYGAFLDAKSADLSVAVIGRNVAETLFQDSVPLGEKFTFRGETFLVRGMFDEFKSSPLSPTANFDNAIFISYKVAERLTGNSAQMYTILAKPDEPQNAASAIASVEENLRHAHGGQRDFNVLDRKESLEHTSDVLNLLTTMIASVAAISLIVGGVGIMNIMLVSVTERMHEIGVRKAIGATSRQIMNQFLAESVVLSLAGGVIGILISLLIDLLLHAYTDLKPVVSWRAIVLATGVSLAVGVIFGVAPAVKAARKDPIQALRHE